MYKHVLVPVSFDEDRDAAGAVEVAKLLVDKGGRVTMIHVMEKIPSYAISYVPDKFLKESRDAIEKEMAELAVDLPNAQTQVVDGHSGRTIVHWAGQNDVDCIVLASHRPGMQDILLGSTAGQVVRHAECAVHVLR